MRPLAAALATLAVICLVTLPIRWHQHRHEAATSQQENPTIGSDDGRIGHPRAARTLWRPPLTPAQATKPQAVRSGTEAEPSPVRATTSPEPTATATVAPARPEAEGKLPTGGRGLLTQLHKLAWCESRNQPTVISANGKWFGLFQFEIPTWRGAVSRAGFPQWADRLPSDAPPDVQTAAAIQLHSERGWQPWPACSKRLGFAS